MRDPAVKSRNRENHNTRQKNCQHKATGANRWNVTAYVQTRAQNTTRAENPSRTAKDQGSWENHVRACTEAKEKQKPGKRATCNICGIEQSATNLTRLKRTKHHLDQRDSV